MTGMPKKKENSAAAPLEQPSTIAPKMVEPERDVPGIRESSWNKPINRAVFAEICPTLVMDGLAVMELFSKTMNSTPYYISIV